MSAPAALRGYGLARGALFCLPAETAHTITLALLPLLRASGMLKLLSGEPVFDPVTVMGLQFPNRVGLAAGLDKNARHIRELSAMGFGFVEAGTVTPRAQPGNPRPRMFRLPARGALINRMGFNNDGLEAFDSNLNRFRSLRNRSIRIDGADQATGSAPLIGLNIGKNASTPIENAIDDYLAGLRGVYAHADYIAINISSPNTENLRNLQQENELEHMLAAISDAREQLSGAHGRRVPLAVKIAPDLMPEQIAVIARTLPRHGIDAVIATNTSLSREQVEGLEHADERGGLSGAPVAPMSSAVISQLRADLPPQFPIIGVGGIMSAADASDKLRAGADLIQVYTGLIYRGPALVRECALAARQHSRSD